MATDEKIVGSLDNRLNRILDRIDGMRTGAIPFTTPVLRQSGDHIWVDEQTPAKDSEQE